MLAMFTTIYQYLIYAYRTIEIPEYATYCYPYSLAYFTQRGTVRYTLS